MNLASRPTEEVVDLTFALGMQPCMTTIAASLAGAPDGIRGGLHLPTEVRAEFTAEIRLRDIAGWMRANPERLMEFATRPTRAPYFAALTELGLSLK